MKYKKLYAALITSIFTVSSFTAPLPYIPGIISDSYVSSSVEAASVMRRPCSSESPMWIVHIETWNTPDPQKIINLIPEDIKPYVVFNISMSIYWSNDKHEWGMVQDGYELAKSWLKTCADEGIWCMVQPSSGGQCHLPDYDSSGNIVDFPNKDEFVAHADSDYENTIYAEFFRDYPNFIGFNYCEQFWGFEQNDFPITCAQRYQHFANLLKLCNKYGGYLDISWCGNEWSPKINPLAMLKQVPSWEESCRNYSDNLILEEKYTQASYIEDVESLVYGYYISGYCGNFGIRYDETGWTDSTWSGTGVSTKDQFNQTTGLPIYFERMVKNGATVIDGPELTTVDDFKEISGYTDSEGYHVRDWAMYDQFQNVPMDFMRKIVDGTVRIPSRKEVIEDTKVVIIQDVADGAGKTWDAPYSTYPTLFEGLYRMANDGNLKNNHNLYKSTGRYQTIPTVYALNDSLAKSIPVQVKQSEIESRWNSIEAKQSEFNNLYSSDYYGNCYVGRNENTWIAYNSNKDGSNCGAVLSLKYNTCKEMDVNFNSYGNAVINEYSDHIEIYTNNYDNKNSNTLRTDTFKISGCSSEPAITYSDRGINQTKSQISTSYSNGVYTISVKHNGPVDISVKCSGTETGRGSAISKTALTSPAAPAFYTGVRQYEAEVFDYKNIEGNVPNACGSGVTNILGQGFMKFGKNSNAAVKDNVSVNKAGEYMLNLRYSSVSDINNVDLYVNGSKIETMKLSNTSDYSNWKYYSKTVTLKQGDNKIEFKANSTLSSSLYLDCFTIDGNFVNESAQTAINGTLIKNLVVADTENAADWSIGYNFNNGSNIYGDRDFTCTSSGIVKGTEYIKTACDSKLFTQNLAEFTAAKDMYVYVALDNRVVENLPNWLNEWTKTSSTIKISNDVTFTLFRKQVKADEKVILGTNGGSGNSANYIVFASTSLPSIKGDINLDGSADVLDIILLQKYFLGTSDLTAAQKAQADINSDGMINICDVCELKNVLTGKKPEISSEDYMNQFVSKVSEFEGSNSTAEKSGVQYGSFEKVKFTSAVCGGRTKNFNVLLPANYNKNKKYPVLYILHGYWGNEDALLDSGDSSLKLKQIIGNAVADGEAEDMIVVFPDIYASDTQDKCDGLNDKNNKAYDNFINELTKEIMPYMEKNYSIKTGRENTAITGFSMGGRESLYIGFSRPDLFGYVGAMCPAPGLNTDLIANDQLKFNEVSPYLLMLSAGSNDQIVYSTPSGYHNTLTNNGVNHIWHYVTDGDHGGKTIRPHVYNFIRFIFKA